MSQYYTVKWGDSPASVARDVLGDERAFAELVALNGGADWTPGMKIQIPDRVAAVPFVSNELAAYFGGAPSGDIAAYYRDNPGAQKTGMPWSKTQQETSKAWARGYAAGDLGPLTSDNRLPQFTVPGASTGGMPGTTRQNTPGGQMSADSPTGVVPPGGLKPPPLVPPRNVAVRPENSRPVAPENSRPVAPVHSAVRPSNWTEQTRGVSRDRGTYSLPTTSPSPYYLQGLAAQFAAALSPTGYLEMGIEKLSPLDQQPQQTEEELKRARVRAAAGLPPEQAAPIATRGVPPASTSEEKAQQIYDSGVLEIQDALVAEDLLTQAWKGLDWLALQNGLEAQSRKPWIYNSPYMEYYPVNYDTSYGSGKSSSYGASGQFGLINFRVPSG
jgi:hypothetical protein